MDDSKYVYVRSGYFIHDNKFSNGESTNGCAEIIFAISACIGKLRYQGKSAGNGVNEAIRGVKASAIVGYMEPDVVEVGFRA